MAYLETVFIEGNAGAVLDSAAGTPNSQALTIQGNAIGVPVPVTMASTTITGSVAVTQSTSPWIVAGGGTAGTPGTAVLTVQGIAGGTAIPISGTVTTTPPANATTNITQWDSTALGAPSAYGTSPGAVTVPGVNAFITNTVATTLASTTITGTVAVTQSTSPWVISGTVTTTPSGLQNVNLTQLNSVALGSPSNYGTAPGAVEVQGVNAFITNTVATTLASTTITGTVAVTQSTSPWVVSLASTTITGTVAENLTQWAGTVLGTPTNFGTTPGAVIAGSVNSSLFSGTTALTNTAGALNVNITGGSETTTGTLTNNNAPPAATNLGVLPAIAETAYGTVTYTTGNQVLPVTDLHGALNQDLQAYAGTQLTGTVTAYGTAPTGNVFGVNAFITNTVPVTLTSTTITGTVAVTQSTSPWVVSGTVTTTPPANASTNITQWDSTALGAPSAYGTSPGAVTVPGVNAFVTNTVATTLASTTITGTVAVTQSTSPWVDNLTQVAGVALGATAVTAFGTAPAAVNVPGVNSSLYAGVTGLTATGTSLNVNVTNAAGPFTVSGNLTNNNAAPAANNVGVLPALANAAAPTYTEGDQVLLSVALDGHLRVGTKTNNSTAPVANTNVGSLGALANAASPAWTEGNQVFGSVDLTGRQRVRGTLTHNNAAPSSDLIGVMNGLANAAAPTYTEGDLVLQSVDLSGNTRIVGTKTNNSAAPTTQVGVIPAVANAAVPTWTEGDQVLLSEDLSGHLRIVSAAGGLTNNNAAPTATLDGVLPAIAETTYATVTYTTGDMVLPVTDLHGALNTDLQAVAGSAVSTAGTGVQLVGIAGHNNAVMDGTASTGTVPANGILTLSQYTTTARVPTNGQSLALQSDSAGSLFVNTHRRSSSVAQATTITSSAAATSVLPAQAAGVFADICSLIITATPAVTTALVFTATLSDGTASYVFDMDTGSVAAPSVPIVLEFPVPLPATTAATAWTIALSVATVTVHITVVAALQKAS